MMCKMLKLKEEVFIFYNCAQEHYNAVQYKHNYVYVYNNEFYSNEEQNYVAGILDNEIIERVLEELKTILDWCILYSNKLPKLIKYDNLKTSYTRNKDILCKLYSNSDESINEYDFKCIKDVENGENILE